MKRTWKTKLSLVYHSYFIGYDDHIAISLMTVLLLSNLSNWFFKGFAKLIKKAANSTYLVQFATISHSQIYQESF